MRLFLPLVLAACGPRLVAEPGTVNAAAYQPVTFDLSGTPWRAEDVEAVQVGGIAALHPIVEADGRLTVTVQGAPEPGLQAVTLTVAGEAHVVEDALEYAAPLDPGFRTLAAMGASITQGTQGGVPNQHAILHSPPHLVARALGSFLPLPLLVDPLFPPIGWGDVGQPPGCELPDVVGYIAGTIVDVIGLMEDEERDRIGFYLAREDPGLAPRNVAVGNTKIASLVNGPPDDITEQFLVKMVYATEADIRDNVSTSQLELVEAMEPDVILVPDPYGNDLIASIVLSRRVDVGQLTTVDSFTQDVHALVTRLAATGAEVFIGNMPRATVLPATPAKRASTIAAASDPEAATAKVDADLATIDARTDAFNDLLDAEAAVFDNVHVVDFRGMVLQLQAEGYDLDGVHLTVEKFGGLLSTDGVHLGDVGNGLFAQLFLDALEEVFGMDLPAVDLSALLAADPFSPAAALAAGYDTSACE